MKYIKNPNSYLVVLAKGESLMASLESFASSENLKAAWMNGIGAASNLTVGLYVQETKDYRWKTYNEQLEITSLQGDLSWVDGKPFWHIHGTFSGEDYRSIGGHLKDLTISVTGELFITPMATPLTRTFDEETGIKLLDTAS